MICPGPSAVCVFSCLPVRPYMRPALFLQEETRPRPTRCRWISMWPSQTMRNRRALRSVCTRDRWWRSSRKMSPVTAVSQERDWWWYRWKPMISEVLFFCASSQVGGLLVQKRLRVGYRPRVWKLKMTLMISHCQQKKVNIQLTPLVCPVKVTWGISLMFVNTLKRGSVGWAEFENFLLKNDLWMRPLDFSSMFSLCKTVSKTVQIPGKCVEVYFTSALQPHHSNMWKYTSITLATPRQQFCHLWMRFLVPVWAVFR